jgi:hypothetical protein
MLVLRRRLMARSAALVPSPNRRSKAVRGLISVGSGVVGEVQEMLFV